MDERADDSGVSAGLGRQNRRATVVSMLAGADAGMACALVHLLTPDRGACWPSWSRAVRGYRTAIPARYRDTARRPAVAALLSVARPPAAGLSGPAPGVAGDARGPRPGGSFNGSSQPRHLERLRNRRALRVPHERIGRRSRPGRGDS